MKNNRVVSSGTISRTGSTGRSWGMDQRKNVLHGRYPSTHLGWEVRIMWEADLAMVTLQDCLDMQRCKDQSAIIENGQVVGFTEEVPDQSGNSGQAQ